MRADLIDQITGRGYWRVNFRPRSEGDALAGVGAGEQAVLQSSVHLRGWPYPYAVREPGQGDNGTELDDKFATGWIDWERHREFWRIYRSSQFINYRGLGEDWDERGSFGERSDYDPHNRELRVLSAVFQIAEIYAFLERLRERGLYSAGVEVGIDLKNCGPRALRTDGAGQMPFMFDKVSNAREITHHVSLEPDQILDVERNAVTTAADIFDRFRWNPPRDQLTNQVGSYLAGRFYV